MPGQPHRRAGPISHVRHVDREGPSRTLCSPPEGFVPDAGGAGYAGESGYVATLWRKFFLHNVMWQCYTETLAPSCCRISLAQRPSRSMFGA